MLPALQDWLNSSRLTLGVRDALLRKVDATLQAYHAVQGAGVMGKINLADIFAYTIQWMRQNPKSGRFKAVADLNAAAVREVSSEFDGAQISTLSRVAKGDSLKRVTATVKMLRAGKLARNPALDLVRAIEIWAVAGISFATDPHGQRWPQSVELTLANGTTLGNQADEELYDLVNLCNVTRIFVCYAPQLAAGGAIVAGKAERPSGHGGLRHPFIKIAADLARDESLAHELGHVLTDTGLHHHDPQNLMADGGVRCGTALTPGQIVLARSSPQIGG